MKLKRCEGGAFIKYVHIKGGSWKRVREVSLISRQFIQGGPGGGVKNPKKSANILYGRPLTFISHHQEVQQARKDDLQELAVAVAARTRAGHQARARRATGATQGRN